MTDKDRLAEIRKRCELYEKTEYDPAYETYTEHVRYLLQLVDRLQGELSEHKDNFEGTVRDIFDVAKLAGFKFCTLADIWNQVMGERMDLKVQLDRQKEHSQRLIQQIESLKSAKGLYKDQLDILRKDFDRQTKQIEDLTSERDRLKELESREREVLVEAKGKFWRLKMWAIEENDGSYENHARNTENLHNATDFADEAHTTIDSILKDKSNESSK